MPQLQTLLGREVDHDPRSLAYPFKVVTPKRETDTFWEIDAPVLNQADVGGCVGWTGADLLNTEAFRQIREKYNGGAFLTDADGLRFYEAATKADNIPGYYLPGDPNSQDTGSSGLGLGKALKAMGLITSYTHVVDGFDALAQALLRGPVAGGTYWTQSMFTPDRSGICHAGLLTRANVRGGHEYMMRGISFTRELILCRNHWTKQWNGRKLKQKLPGEFWLTFSDVEALLAAQGDITVLHGIGTP